MSSSTSDGNNSQDDSEINFIPGYVMEVEDDAIMPSTDAITNEDEWFVMPYQDEPIADEDWVANYSEQRKLEEDKLGMLQSRLIEGRDKVDTWCKCGNCSIELLQNAKECQCCWEIEACVEAVNSDQVLLEVGSAPSCVTLHPGFKPVCLEVWSLRLAGRKYRKIDKRKYEMNDTESRYLRSVSYREYIQLVYGYLGRHRVPLPACAYNAIRRTFVEEKEFTGYEDE